MGAIGDVAAAITGGKGGLSPEDSNNIATLTENSSGFKDGITEVKSIAQKQLNYVSDIAVDVGERGWFAETLSKLVDNFEQSSQRDEEGQSLSESIKDILSDMKVFEETTANDNKEKKKKKGKVSDRTKLDDLKSLPYEYATLGAVLANVLSNKDEKKDKKGGISGFFKGLLEGVGGIAALGVALLAFAGATLIFNFVDWGKAVIGMLAFTVFTIGMVGLAKLLKPEKKNLESFAAASLMMSAALGVFALSLYIVSAVVGSQPVVIAGKEIVPAFSLMNAIAGVAVFLGFIAGVAIISNLVTSKQKDLVQFATASLILSAALGVFALSLYVVSAVVGGNGVTIDGKEIIPRFNLDDAKIGLGMFMGFIAVLAVLSAIVGENGQSFVKFAGASMLMSLSLVVFTFSLAIVSAVYNGEETKIGDWVLPKVDIGNALIGLGLFLGFIVAFTGVAILANNFAGNIAIFTGVSMLMSVSLVLFSVAMAITAGVVSGEGVQFGDVQFSPPQNVAVNALKGIGLMAAFMTAFAGLGALFMVPFAGAAMAAGIAIASGILLLIGGTVIVMAKALALTGLLTTGGEMEWDGQKFTAIPVDEGKIDAAFDPFFALMDKIVEMGTKIKGQGGFFPWQKKGGVDSGAIRMVGSVADVIVKVAQCIAESMTIRKKVEDAGAKWDVHVMDGCLDYVIQVVEKLGVVADNLGWWAAAKMPVLTKSMMPVIDAMDKIVDVIEKALLLRYNLEQKGVKFVGDGIDPQILNGICDPVLQVLLGPDMDGSGGLAGAADSLGFWGGKALESVTKSMVPVAETIGLLVDTIEKAATLGGSAENAKALIDQGIQNMTYIMVGDGETKTSGFGWFKKETITGGFVGLFNTIAKGVEKIGPAAESIKAMKDLVDSLVSVFEAVGKLSNADPGDINKVVENFGRILGKESSTSLSFSWFKGVSIEKNEATGLMGIIESLGAVNTSNLKKASDNAGSMKSMIESVCGMMTAASGMTDLEGFKALADVPSFVNFANSMDDFDVGMKRLAKAYDRVKDIPEKWISGIGASFVEISEVHLDNLDKMALFTEKAKALGDTATNLERIAKAFNKISAAEKIGDLGAKVKGVFTLNNKNSDSAQAAAANATNAQAQNRNNSGMTIEDILIDWYRNGVKIKQNLEGAKEEPKPVNLLSID